MTLSICTAQLNFVVGDMPGNAQKIIAAAREAYAQGARLLLTPELAICGYAAEDLFLRPAFIAACDDAVKTVARETAGLKGLAIVLGHPQAMAPGAQVNLRETSPDFPWIIDEPFGLELVLVVASERPLFATPRPDEEGVAALATALEQARDASRQRLAARAITDCP